MNCKKMIMTTLMLLSLAAPVMAQTTTDMIELLRSDIRTEKRAIVTRAMHLDEAQGAKFWPVYSEYEASLTKMNDERVTLIKDYAAVYNSITAAASSSRRAARACSRSTSPR